MSDYESADPLAGSGLTADDHGEESWADERTPWDEPEEETREEQEGKEESLAAVEDETTKLDRRIRKLGDSRSYLLGIDLDRGARWRWEQVEDEIELYEKRKKEIASPTPSNPICPRRDPTTG
jgi:hypothetical protein